MTEKDSNSMRLNKYISESGFCSRREADKYVEAKNVFINGKIAQLGDRVGPKDVVRVNGIEIEPRPKDEAIYILFNKPTGVTSTTDSSDKDNIIDYIRYGERIFPVGRLDKDSQGLIILTSNGDIVNKILRAGNQHEKEYVVTVDKPVTPQFVEAMSSGVPILGVNTRKCKIHAESKFIFRITLTQGMNRQIRRMCEHFGYTVVKLERVRIMNLSVKGIALGDYREMKPKELAELHELIKDSEMSTDPMKMTKSPGLKDAERSMHIARSLQGKTAPTDEIPKKKEVHKTTPASNPKSALNRKSGSSRPGGSKRFGPGSKPGSRPGSRPSNRPGSSRPDSYSESNSDSRIDSRPSTRPDSRPSARTEGRPSARTEGRPSGRPEGRPSGRPEGRPSGRPDSRPGGRPDSRPGSRPSSRPGSSKPGGRPGSKPGGRSSSAPRSGGRPAGKKR